jgi:hydroxymethylpyrimidine pyrophosphatase-like HAD family hydrolase
VSRAGADALGQLAERWRQLGEDQPDGLIRVVLADVDGVVTPGEGHPASLGVLEQLTHINAAALEDARVPAVTLCTGRQAPYVELMAQMTGVFLPCSFEHGAGLFFPRAFRYIYDPRLGEDHFQRVARVRAELRLDGRGFVQPGKEAMITLFPLPGTPLDELAQAAEDAVARVGLPFSVELNATGVEVRPRGIDKGEGCRWLADLVRLPLGQVCGVGDSDPDLAFLRLPGLGLAAAPANATPGVRAAVSCLSSAADGAGLLEIVAEVERRNRSM